MPRSGGVALRRQDTTERLGWGPPDGARLQARRGSTELPDPKLMCSVVVQKESLATAIKKRSVERQACLSLPFTIALFCSYSISVAYHEDVRTVFLVESSIRSFLEDYTFDESHSKTLNSIAHKEDFWKWMFQALVPSMFKQQDHLGLDLPRDEWSVVLGKNRMRGGLLFEQFRRPGSIAPGHKQAASNSTEDPVYFAGEGLLPIAETPAGSDFQKERRLRSGKAVGGKQSIGANAKPDGPSGEPENTYPFLLFEQDTVDTIVSRLKYLERERWIDKATSQVALKMILLNDDIKLVQQVIIRFVFPETGGIYSAVTIQSSFLKAWRTWVVVLADFCCLILLLYISCLEFYEVYKHWRENQTQLYFKDFWNCLDWMTIVLGWAITGMFLDERLRNDQLSKVLDTVSSGKPDADYWARMYDVHQKADSLAWVNLWWRLLLVYFMLLVMCRFFKAFKGQSKLAVVTNTIYSAGSDLFHFGLIFVCVFLTFAFAGTILFGRRMSGFSSFKIAFGTSFAIVCGDFDWTAMSHEHYATASIWFWSFMVIVFFIMLNMVLAIVMDVYAKVRANAVDGDPIWKNAAALIQRMRKSRVWSRKSHSAAETHVAESELFLALERLGQKITVERLQAAVPTLSYRQAMMLIQDADFFEKRNGSQGLSISDAMRLISRINRKVDQLALAAEVRANASPEESEAERIKRLLRKRVLRNKVKRIMIGALRDGELKRVCADLHDDHVIGYIKEKELKRKIQRADELLEFKRKASAWTKAKNAFRLTNLKADERPSVTWQIDQEQGKSLPRQVGTDVLRELHALRAVVIGMSKQTHEMYSVVMNQQSGYAGPPGEVAMPHKPPENGGPHVQPYAHQHYGRPGRAVVPWKPVGQGRSSPVQKLPESSNVWHERSVYHSHPPSSHPEAMDSPLPGAPFCTCSEPPCTCSAPHADPRGLRSGQRHHTYHASSGSYTEQAMSIDRSESPFPSEEPPFTYGASHEYPHSIPTSPRGAYAPGATAGPRPPTNPDMKQVNPRSHTYRQHVKSANAYHTYHGPSVTHLDQEVPENHSVSHEIAQRVASSHPHHIASPRDEQPPQHPEVLECQECRTDSPLPGEPLCICDEPPCTCDAAPYQVGPRLHHGQQRHIYNSAPGTHPEQQMLPNRIVRYEMTHCAASPNPYFEIPQHAAPPDSHYVASGREERPQIEAGMPIWSPGVSHRSPVANNRDLISPGTINRELRSPIPGSRDLRSPGNGYRELARSNTHHYERSRPVVDAKQYHSSEGHMRMHPSMQPYPDSSSQRPHKPPSHQRLQGHPGASSSDEPSQSPTRVFRGEDPGQPAKHQPHSPKLLKMKGPAEEVIPTVPRRGESNEELA